MTLSKLLSLVDYLLNVIKRIVLGKEEGMKRKQDLANIPVIV